jgi:signal transduction histidine kinase
VPPLRCDEDKLHQVLVNLVENAVKYSPDGGRVTVEVSANAEHGRIVVRDEGLGIPAGEQERIFEKFYRLDPSLARGVGGSGLGLYISRELVERMQGQLTVSSEAGRGSTFVVELPRA